MTKDIKQIIEEIKNYPGKKVKVAITDIDGVLRGKVMHRDKFLSVLEGGFGFCNVVFGWDMADLAYDNVEYTGWHTGYPDANAIIDPQTFRKIPWDQDMPFFLADFRNAEGKTLEICPRGLLKTVKGQAEAMGFKAFFSQEFEWFNFRENQYDLHDREFRSPEPLTKGMFGYSVLRAGQNREFFNDLFDLMSDFEVPLEGLHTETGPGVYEAAILYDDILESADRAVLFKASAKEIGDLHGIMPTFMAKFDEKLPGCSGHVHQSLWRDGKNAFYSKDDEKNMSPTMRSYMAGVLHCLPHLLPLYAPTINSYKRLVEGAWAPTTVTWAVDNRTVALRALPGSDKSTRAELRVVGSDTNPYLAMAAALASGLYGIKNNMKLEVPETVGNGYRDNKNGVLPKDLNEATKIFKSSPIAKELLGEAFVEHFSKTREWEWRRFSASVTDWELKRYFEII